MYCLHMAGDMAPKSSQNPDFRRIIDVLSTVLGAFSIKVALSGAVLILAGYVIQEGVVAGMLPIWGGALVLLGLGTYALTWYTNR